jgi:uroporphyrinogen-III synthase/uroporphyrinogen III methyltransferase/synthase
LAGKGYRVVTVVAYRTVVRPPTREIAVRLAAGEFAAVLFTSPSTVRALDGRQIAPGTVLGAIGEPTAAAATAAGRAISFVAPAPRAKAFVAALVTHARSIQEA